MKPIAQTFYINEPENGVAGVYLTGVDLFFKSKSPTFGVTIQIRQTENGSPTKYVMPFGIAKCSADKVKVSDDASLRTQFKFSAPVFLQSATSYALVIIPDGGNPDYQIWTGEIGGTDVTTNSPIKTNNDTGTLFLSSNDIQFTSVASEDIKFVLYIADFLNTTGTAVFNSRDSDYLLIKDQIGSFATKEYVVVSNNAYNLAKLTYTSNTGAFTVGETVYQSNGSANVATGILYSMGTGAMKITNSNGAWSNSYQVRGATSSSNATITVIVANVVTSNASNTITVPYTDLFSANQMIYIGASNRSYMMPSSIDNVVDGTTLQLTTDARFTDTNALLGRVLGDGALHAKIEASDNNINPNRIQVTLAAVTSNSTLNFSNSTGKFLIGATSGTSANVISAVDMSFNTIVPQFAQSAPGDTNIGWTFTGVENNTSRTPDSNETIVTNFIEKELYDKPRVLMSRSNEYSNLPSGRRGDYTTQVYAYLSSANNKISPVIDYAKTNITVLGNATVPEGRLNGYRITFADTHPFAVGDTVMQQNSVSSYVIGTANVYTVSDNQIIIGDVTGYFTPLNGTVLLSTNTSTNAAITDVSVFNEKLNNNLKYASRYISKGVILAEGQDAEDIRCYLTAYRPATTDLLVYARIQNKEDPDNFQQKTWTRLNQLTSPALLSSGANVNDFIELEYGFPHSTELFNQATSCNTSSANVTMSSTADLNAGDFVYIADTTSSKFTVTKVRRVVNSSVVIMNDLLPFVASNAAIGVIPNLESAAGAFVYTENNNIVRYVSGSNIVYDSYKSFAIKIVPVSDSTAVVPRVKDMRAIALQV